MTGRDLLAFIRRYRLGVVATVSPAGTPQAAVVGVAVTDDLELVFDTVETTRKVVNLRQSARVAVVIGWDHEQTAQLEGITDEPHGAELERLKRCYFEAFPDGPTRQAWPGITYFRVRLDWARLSDFRGPEAVIEELSGAALSARAMSA